MRKNGVLLYELLDEVIDYGFPQNSSSEALREFVLNEPTVLHTAVRARAPSPNHPVLTWIKWGTQILHTRIDLSSGERSKTHLRACATSGFPGHPLGDHTGACRRADTSSCSTCPTESASRAQRVPD